MPKTPTSGQLWVVLARCHKSLSVLVERSIARDGLCLSDFMILEALLHKGPLTITEIQGKVLLASGSMTAAVDRLENRQFIVRKATGEDRRARQLHLTEEGRKFITTVFEAHYKELENWLSVLTAEEKRQAYALLKKLGLSAAAVHQAGTNSLEEKRQA
ncbi:MAG: MarR family transcriptional regulator, and catechol-resistance regulon repressor [Bryobacterales bacterium]|jgi:MarR family 2-MHQ and catechol resistance regulon transcriptional repressor|nr:MarR family transcriptional regulator, and catechol-resistance regulon repressor [Bryobacterales bacterium]